MKRLKNILTVILSFVLLLSSVPFNESYVHAAANSDENARSSSSHITKVPEGYIGIYTKADLDAVRNNLSGNYILMNDIEFTDADFAEGGVFYNGGAGWEPIGDENNAFSGTFDGDEHVIKNLYVNISGDSQVYAGLFGRVDDGTIKNIGMVDGKISTTGSSFYAYIGGVAGYVNYNGVITNCYNTGMVSASSSYNAYAGGIVGEMDGIIITNCYNIGEIYAFSDYAYAGGIAGYSGAIENCYNTGTVSATSSGPNDQACAGGIAGEPYCTTVTNCYSVGVVSANSSTFAYAGNIAGTRNVDLVNCYYLNGSGSDNLEQMQQQATYVGFNFDTVWSFEENYPFPQLRENPHKKIITLEITQKPTKLAYLEEEALDSTGMVVTAYRNNMPSVVTDYAVFGDTSAPGTKTISVIYCGEIATFTVAVNAKTLMSIDVTQKPNKLTYLDGDPFDNTGMVVTAYYNNNTSAVVANYTISGYTSTPGTKTISVSYGGKAATFAVTVNAKTLTSITVTKQPNKLTYLEGESFDKTGMVVTAHYANSPSVAVSDYTISGYTPTAGAKTITVSYGGKTATFLVVVEAKKESSTTTSVNTTTKAPTPTTILTTTTAKPTTTYIEFVTTTAATTCATTDSNPTTAITHTNSTTAITEFATTTTTTTTATQPKQSFSHLWIIITIGSALGVGVIALMIVLAKNKK